MSDLDYSSESAKTIAELLFGADSGIKVNSADLIGTSAQTRTYSNGDDVAREATPGDNGVIFSTGRAEDFNAGWGDNRNDHLSSDMHNHWDSDQGRDRDIEDVVPGSARSYDAAGIELNFTATESGTYTVPLTFLTEEYPVYYGTAYSDSAAVFLGDENGNNMEQLPISHQDGGYFNLNSMENGPYRNNGDTGHWLRYNTDFNAIKTGHLTLEVEAGKTYTLKIVVADFNDAKYDSALMIGEGAFTSTAPPCFTAGTLIATPDGPRPVEDLAPGDLVMTLDHGPQPLRWHAATHVAASRLAKQPNLCPVQIRAGALGPGVPARDLSVSQQHRMLVRSRIAQRMFGAEEILVAAKHLIGLPGVTLGTPEGPVSYHHLVFDGHEVIDAEGAAAESLYLGAQALRSLSPAARAELAALFPDLLRRLAEGESLPAARPLVAGKRGRRMQLRHRKNHQPLQPAQALTPREATVARMPRPAGVSSLAATGPLESGRAHA